MEHDITQVFSSHCSPHNGLYTLIRYKMLINTKSLSSLLKECVVLQIDVAIISQDSDYLSWKKSDSKGMLQKWINFFHNDFHRIDILFSSYIVIFWWYNFFRKVVKLSAHFLLFELLPVVTFSVLLGAVEGFWNK